MPSRFALTLYEVSTWVIPLNVAITFHEAAHGFVAHLFGDDADVDFAVDIAMTRQSMRRNSSG